LSISASEKEIFFKNTEEIKMKFKYTITGLDCPNCAAKLAGMMESIDGVDSARINFLAEKLTVESTLDEGALLAKLRTAARAFSSDVEIN
jgi:Cd2+/Zn2+-exporting ATPase